MEKLFAQILEGKKQIVEQIRQQTALVDQHLASKCILDGIAPPPWLFPSTGLNEELISGLLLPCPPTSLIHTSNLYSQHYYKNSFVEKGDFPDGVNTEAGDRLSGSPQLPVNDPGGSLCGVEKPDSSSASSPLEQREAQVPDVTPEAVRSLASFQRSKSRQKALELRNSAKTIGSRLRGENSSGLFGSGNRCSEIASLREDSRVGLLEGVESSYDKGGRCVIEEANEGDLVRKDTESRKQELISSTLLSGSQAVAPGCSNDLVPCNKGALLFEHEEVLFGSDPEVDNSTGAADGQSDLLQLPVQDGGGGSNAALELEAGAVSPLDQRNARDIDIKHEPIQSLARVQRSRSRQRALEYRDSEKAAKSRFSVENKCDYSSIDNKFDIATPMSGQDHERELVKPAKVNNEGIGAEETQERFFRGRSNYYSGRSTRSRSSCQQPNSLRMPSRLGKPSSVRRSLTGEPNEDRVESSGVLIEENPTCLRSFCSNEVGSGLQQVGDHTTDAESASPISKDDDAGKLNTGGSPIDRLDSMAQPMTELSKLSSVRTSHSLLDPVNDLAAFKPFDRLSHVRISHSLQDPVDGLEAIKPVGGSYETSVVQEEKLGVVHSIGKSNKNYSGRITRSQSSKVSPMKIVSPVNQSNSAEQLVRMSSPLLQYGQLVPVNPINIYHETCWMEESKEGEFQRREDSSHAHSVRTTRSQSSKATPFRNISPIDKMDQVDKLMRVASESSLAKVSSRPLEHAVQSEPAEHVAICFDSHVEEEVKASDLQSNGDGNVSSGRITRSRCARLSLGGTRRSIDKMDTIQPKFTGSTKSSPIRHSSPPLEHVDRSEWIKPVDISFENCKAEEAIVGNLRSTEDGNGFCSRVSSSRCSSQETGSMRESLKFDVSFGKKENSSNSSQQVGKKLMWSESKLSCGEYSSSPQIKRRRTGSPVTDSLSASPILADVPAAQVNVVGNSVVANDLDGSCQVTEGSKSSRESSAEKGELSVEERATKEFSPFTFSQEESEMPSIPSVTDQAADVRAEEADTTNIIHDLREQETKQDSDVLLHLDHRVDVGTAENMRRNDIGLQEETPHLEENGNGSLGTKSAEVPEFERLVMQTDSERGQPDVTGTDISLRLNLPQTTLERASILEQLCKSACMQTPLSDFSTTYKLHGVSDQYQSVPNGLLECIDMKSNLDLDGKNGMQLKVSYNFFKEEVNQSLEERSHSLGLPVPSSQSPWNIKNPFTSPVEKLWNRTTSNSSSSGNRGSLNAELPCISEENENPDEVVEVVQEEMQLHERKPLADITESHDIPESVSEAEIFAARASLDSVNTNYSYTGAFYDTSQKLGHNYSSKKGLKDKVKMSNNVSTEEWGTSRMSESIQGRFTKSKLSEKPSSRKEGPSLGGRGAKRNNIVSNVTSFVPLVQKPAAPIITGKRDVKVKALEAAEAAKRLAQEKENERKMKKEAIKLERARLEQENLKQMKLEKQQKEEERKKKESEMAARKRLREEEEKKEKERKRNRAMETRKQQQENEEKLRVKKAKELKSQPVSEPAKDIKTSKLQATKDKKGKETVDKTLGNLTKTGSKTTMVSVSDSIKANIIDEASTDYGDNSKVQSYLEKATVDNICTSTYLEESYDMSPYKESDDEDDEESDDNIPNKKFIPSWASKSCLARAVASQQYINPDLMFAPETICSISEVVMPRRLKQK